MEVFGLLSFCCLAKWLAVVPAVVSLAPRISRWSPHRYGEGPWLDLHNKMCLGHYNFILQKQYFSMDFLCRVLLSKSVLFQRCWLAPSPCVEVGERRPFLFHPCQQCLCQSPKGLSGFQHQMTRPAWCKQSKCTKWSPRGLQGSLPPIKEQRKTGKYIRERNKQMWVKRKRR